MHGFQGALLLQGEVAPALSQWRAALRIYPQFVAARYNLACALLDIARQQQPPGARIFNKQD